MLVSWEGFNEEDNTWEPVQNLPPGMVEAFRNRMKQQKRMESSSTQDELLEGSFYVKEIQKERTRKRCKQMLVSWEGFDEKHNTWEPIKNLPTEMVEAFRNRQKKQSKQTKKGLNNLLLKEIDRRAKFSTKSRTERGTFAKKDVQDLSWKNYARFFFDQHPGFKSTCQCGKSYEKAESSYILNQSTGNFPVLTVLVHSLAKRVLLFFINTPSVIIQK